VVRHESSMAEPRPKPVRGAPGIPRGRLRAVSTDDAAADIRRGARRMGVGSGACPPSTTTTS
jgi:hypothetical protein